MGLTSTNKTAYSTVSLTTTCDSWFEFVLWEVYGLSPFPQVILCCGLAGEKQMLCLFAFPQVDWGAQFETTYMVVSNLYNNS